MFSHSVFGLHLQGNTAIPGLVPLPVASPADVRLWLGLMPHWLNKKRESQRTWYCSPHLDDRGQPLLKIWELGGGAYFRLWFADGAQFLVDRSSADIWAIWPESLTLEETASHLLGSVLSFAIRSWSINSFSGLSNSLGFICDLSTEAAERQRANLRMAGPLRLELGTVGNHHQNWDIGNARQQVVDELAGRRI